jgi:hypothetical protein
VVDGVEVALESDVSVSQISTGTMEYGERQVRVPRFGDVLLSIESKYVVILLRAGAPRVSSTSIMLTINDSK